MTLEAGSPLRSADNTVHDLIAVSNDLRQHLARDLAAQGYLDLRPRFAPLLVRVSAGHVPQGQLAGMLGISPQAASQTVTLAEACGYVSRLPNPDDGRSKLVSLTDLGRALVGAGSDALDRRASHYEAFVGHRALTRFGSAAARIQGALGLKDGEVGPPGSPRARLVAVSALADHAVRQLRTALQAGGQGAITASQNLVLVYVGIDGSRPSNLARAQRVSRQAVSAILRELAELGLVTRHPDPDDARGVRFVPTALGRRALDVYIGGIDGLERRYQEILGPGRWAEFAATAHDLRHRLGIERSTRSDVPLPGTTPVALFPRADAELADLATDLWRWLGEADAVRLTSLMARMAADSSRRSRVGDGPLTRTGEQR